MASMDVFSGDAFSMRSLTAAVNVPQFSPSRIAELGVFTEMGVTTTKVSVERLSNAVALVQSTTRGGAPAEVASDMRSLYDLNTVRVALSDTISADETQGVRSFGSETEAQTLASEVNRRNQALAANIAATIEYQRFTALQGVTKDANGATLVDTHTVFGTGSVATQEIDTNSTIGGELRSQTSATIRAIESGLGGRPYSRIHAFVDATFFDNMMQNAEVIDSFKYVQGSALRERTSGRSLDFAGITYEEYRPLSGSNPLATGKGIAFPIGSGIFVTRFAPADYNDTVNTVGLPLYARMFSDPDGNRWQRLEVQTNVLNVNVDSSCVVTLDDGVA